MQFAQNQRIFISRNSKLDLVKILTVKNSVKSLLILKKSKENMANFLCVPFVQQGLLFEKVFTKYPKQQTILGKSQSKFSHYIYVVKCSASFMYWACYQGSKLKVVKTFFIFAARKKNRSIRFTILKLRKNNAKSKALKIAKKSCKKCVVNVGSNC